MVGLIALNSSYDHINFGRARDQLVRYCRIWCFLASLAIILVKSRLAKQPCHREEDRRINEANEAARERDRAARREAAQLRRARVEAEASRAQLALLNQALIKLCSSEVPPLYDDEILESLDGLC